MDNFEHSPYVLPPQQERSRIALARIIAGASEVLLREDSDSFSMEDVAKAAGVPVGSIYRRFKGKESIIRAIALDTFMRLEDIIRDRLQGHYFTSAGEVVAELAAGMAEMSEQNDSLVRAVISYSTVTSAEYRGIIMTGRRRLVGYYKEAIYDFLQHVPEQRRDIVIGISYEILSSAIVSKSRGDVPVFIDLSWSDLAEEVARAATNYLKEAV